MSKTTPVRWWRDDAERFRGRGAYIPTPRPGRFDDLNTLLGRIRAEAERQEADGRIAAFIVDHGGLEEIARQHHEQQSASLARWAPDRRPA